MSAERCVMGIQKRFISERKYKVGYVVKTEEWSADGSDWTLIKAAYTPSGEYIGSPKDARALVTKRGIAPEYRTETSSVCSIGFCARDGKWYGWSHRAICGFGVGDMLFEETMPGANDHTPFVEHGTIRIETMEQARQAAANFASYVS